MQVQSLLTSNLTILRLLDCLWKCHTKNCRRSFNALPQSDSGFRDRFHSFFLLPFCGLTRNIPNQFLLSFLPFLFTVFILSLWYWLRRNLNVCRPMSMNLFSYSSVLVNIWKRVQFKIQRQSFEHLLKDFMRTLTDTIDLWMLIHSFIHRYKNFSMIFPHKW